jgi:hypothetical protein
MFNNKFEEIEEKWIKGGQLTDEEIGYLIGQIRALKDKINLIKGVVSNSWNED